eukprot:6522348-Prymnesium_polylepis.1
MSDVKPASISGDWAPSGGSSRRSWCVSLVLRRVSTKEDEPRAKVTCTYQENGRLRNSNGDDGGRDVCDACAALSPAVRRSTACAIVPA